MGLRFRLANLCSMARNGSINVFTLKQCEIDGALELREPLLELCCVRLLNWQKINIEERSNNELDALPTSLPMT